MLAVYRLIAQAPNQQIGEALLSGGELCPLWSQRISGSRRNVPPRRHLVEHQGAAPDDGIKCGRGRLRASSE